MQNKKWFLISLMILCSQSAVAAGWSAYQENALVFPAIIYTSSSSSLPTVGPTATNHGQISITGPAGSIGTAVITSGSPFNIPNITSGGTQAQVYSYTYGGDLTSGGGFQLPSGTGSTTLNNLAYGGSMFINSNSLSGIFQGNLNINIVVGGTTVLTVPLTVNTAMLNSAKISTQSDINFPSQVVDSSSSVTTILSPNSVGAAVFSASCGGGQTGTLTAPSGTINLTNAGTSSVVSVYSFTFGGNAASNGNVTFSGSGQKVVNNIRLGATAFYPASLPGGTYQATNQTLTLNCPSG